MAGDLTGTLRSLVRALFRMNRPTTDGIGRMSSVLYFLRSESEQPPLRCESGSGRPCRSVENLCSRRYAGGYGPVVFRSPVFGVRGVCEGKNRKRESVASETRVRSRPFQGLSASLTRRRNGCPPGSRRSFRVDDEDRSPELSYPADFGLRISVPAFRSRDRKLRCDGTRGFPKTPVP